MDAVEREPTDGLRCDGCGYDRRGLPAGARCPECGDGPPAMVAVVAGNPSRTAGEVAWLRQVAVGLLLLVVGSYYAAQVAVLMNVGSFAVSTVNVAGPKVPGAVLLQRSMGGQPGPLGVQGMTATLIVVAGVWLTTGRRAVRAGGEPEAGATTAAVARWTTVVCVGGTLGVMLNYNRNYLPPMSDVSGRLLLAALVLCELPANLALYLHLRSLAGRLGCRRAAGTLVACSWAVPAVIAAAIGFQATQLNHDAVPDDLWSVVSGVFGVAAVGTTAAATAAVLNLLATAAAAGFGTWFVDWPRPWVDAGDRLRRAAAAVDRDLPRWTAVAGLLLWVGLVPWTTRALLWLPSRDGLGGSVPLGSFVGPTVLAPQMWDRGEPAFTNAQAFDESSAVVAIACLAAVWMITGLRAPAAGRLRVWSTAAVAVPLGLLLATSGLNHPVSRRIEVGVGLLAGQLPATVLVYLYLGRVAARAGLLPLARRFAVVATLVAGTTVLPITALSVWTKHNWQRFDWWIAAAAAAVVATATVATFLAAAAVVRLAWELAKPGPRRG